MIKINRKIINCPHCGKILPENILTGVPKKKVKCSRCGSERNWKDGKTDMGLQRYYCRNCGIRFSER